MGITLQIFSLLTCICIYSSAQGTNNQSGQTLYLPGNIWPQRYWVNIYVDPEPGSFSYWGDVTIEVMCTDDTNTILINFCSLEILINDISVIYADGDALQSLTVNQSNTYVDEEKQILTIAMEEQLKAFSTYNIRIPFKNGYLDYKLTGFYRSFYFDNCSQSAKWLAVTQAEPSYGRCIFPSFDQPNMKARFLISIGHHEKYVALTNKPLDTTEDIPDKPNWVLDHFASTGLLSTYMVTMLVSEFVNSSEGITLPPDNIPVGFWSRPDVQDQLYFASEIVTDSLTFFGNYFNLPAPFRKFDIAVIPDFHSNGGDGYGMVTFRESDALFHPQLSSVTDQVNTALVVAHYMAKQWIGDIVTQQTWDGVWMKEGFCNYFARIYINQKFPNWKSLLIEFVVAFIDSLSADGLEAAHALFFPIDNLTQVDFLYDTISFRKGSLIARFVSIIVGDEVFKEAMVQYVSSFKGSNTRVEFLWEIMTNIAQKSNGLPDGIDLTTIMNTWVYESHYPLLTVNIDDQGVVTVSQEAFIFNPVTETGNENKPCWWLPLFYTTSTELNFENPNVQWMKCEDTTLDVQLEPDDFLLLNLGLTALCRVDYGEQMWKRISQTLLDKQNFMKLDVFSRVQLLSDMYGLAWIGRLNYSFMFETFGFLKYETEYAVWRNAWSILGSLRLMLAGTQLRAAYQQFAASLAKPIFSQLGHINEFPVDDPYQTRFKAFVTSWICGVGEKTCQTPSVEFFQQWFNSDDRYTENPINVNVRLTVYCQGIVFGGQAEWDFLFALYQNTSVLSEKYAIQRALGCSQDEKILRQYLEYSIDSNFVRPQDSIVIFTGMATNDASVPVIRRFFYERFQNIFKFHNGNQTTMGKYLTALYARIMTTEELQEMENFVESVWNDLSDAYLRLREARSVANDNISWLYRNYDVVAQALQEYTYINS